MSKQVELVQGAVDALRATQEVLLSGKCAALTVVAVTADGQVIQHRLFTNNVPMTTVHLGLLSMEHHIATSELKEALKESTGQDFATPPGIVFANVDNDTGKLASSSSRRSRTGE